MHWDIGILRFCVSQKKRNKIGWEREKKKWNIITLCWKLHKWRAVCLFVCVCECLSVCKCEEDSLPHEVHIRLWIYATAVFIHHSENCMFFKCAIGRRIFLSFQRYVHSLVFYVWVFKREQKKTNVERNEKRQKERDRHKNIY